MPVEDLRDLAPEVVESLPFGFIRLDTEGNVVRFNSYESRASGLDPRTVLGRNFFHEVAPCTAVQEFAGRYERMVHAGLPAVESFRYLFRFSGGERLVQIFLSYLPDKEEGLVIVRELSHV
ncbi:MAG TPA: PAS domain-containing protein [Thermoanaerobaculia bacterium]